jgi:maltooligosyltrehalose trehalohydrolase
VAGRLAAGMDHGWHVLLTGEDAGYYESFADKPHERLARSLAEGFAYQGCRNVTNAEGGRWPDGSPRGWSSRVLNGSPW